MGFLRASCVLFVLSSLSFAAVPDRIAGAVDSGQAVQLAHSVHPRVQARYDQGPVEASFQLGYVTLLTQPSPAQQRALNKLLAEQQTPGSPNYHRWLTPEQYADRFGLSQNDIKKLTAWLRAEGFTVQSVARGRNWITFSGTAEQVQNALHTEIRRYDVNGEKHFANATPVSIPASLAGIVTGFRGLHDFRPKPMRQPHRNYYDSHFQANFLAPGDIATIYDVDALYNNGIDGTGQALAIAGQTDVYLADLVNFRNDFGLPAISGCTADGKGILTACNSTNLLYVLLGTDPHAPFAGDLSEADLDLEWSGAVARNAQIIYVNAETSAGIFDSFYYAIDNALAPVISLSYGLCELDEIGFFGPDEAELQKANAEGITFVNSSGDSGVATCDYGGSAKTTPPYMAVNGLSVSYPASSPEVTGVGGTAVVYPDGFSPTYWGTANGSDGGSALQYPPEQGWNDDLEFATFCQANSGNTFCTQNHITSPMTAQEVIGIASSGGGASNCVAVLGGQCTVGFAQPFWQTVIISGQSTRMVPDISFQASPNFPGYIFCTAQSELGSGGSTSSCANGIAAAIDTYNSIVGGTSASAPVFAGMVALLNQYLSTSSVGLGNINFMLYALAHNPANGAFHPITTGDNVVYCQPGTPSNQPVALQCPQSGSFGYQASNSDAGTGYNLVAGLGSVDLNNLAAAWATAPTSDFFTFASVSGSTSHTVKAGQTTLAYNFTVTPTGGTFGSTVMFSCDFSPADPTLTSSTCNFNPSEILQGTAGATPVAMTITTAGPNTGTGSAIQHRVPTLAKSARAGHPQRPAPWPLVLPIAGVALAGIAGSRVWKHSAVTGMCASLVLLGLLVACGGGSAPITVGVNPGSVNLYPNVAGANGWPAQVQAFSAVVSNTSNAAVTWSVSSGGGTIDASGNYTAPATVPSPATVTVTATSQADSTKSGTATVKILTPTGLGTYNVAVTAIESGKQQSQQVTLTVQ